MAGFFYVDEMNAGEVTVGEVTADEVTFGGADKAVKKIDKAGADKRNSMGTGFHIMAASDLHYLSPQLMDYSGKFRELCEALQEPEMEHLEVFMEEWLERVLEIRPDALLITGDLSYQGEKLSHIQLAGKLARLVQSGIPVYVVPGNQDLDNPFSACWKPEGDRDYTPVEPVSPREFQGIYSKMGYGSGDCGDGAERSGAGCNEYVGEDCGDDGIPDIFDAGGVISRAPDSLSYQVCLRKPSGEILYLFMLDTTIAGSSSGRIAPGTFAWLEDRLVKIRETGKNQNRKLPCMIAGHHPMLPLDDETVPFVLVNGQELAGLMQKYGVSFYISGHLHRAGIVRYSQKEQEKQKRKKPEEESRLKKWLYRIMGQRSRPVVPANLYLEKRGLRRIR